MQPCAASEKPGASLFAWLDDARIFAPPCTQKKSAVTMTALLALTEKDYSQFSAPPV
jgi:hypothetical protein